MRMAGATGLEPAASSVTGQRSAICLNPWQGLPFGDLHSPQNGVIEQD